MGIAIFLIYLIGLMTCIFLIGYYNLEGETFIIAIFWPATAPIFLILAIGFLIYAAGKYIKDQPCKSFWKYIEEDVL